MQCCFSLAIFHRYARGYCSSQLLNSIPPTVSRSCATQRLLLGLIPAWHILLIRECRNIFSSSFHLLVDLEIFCLAFFSQFQNTFCFPPKIFIYVFMKRYQAMFLLCVLSLSSKYFLPPPSKNKYRVRDKVIVLKFEAECLRGTTAPLLTRRRGKRGRSCRCVDEDKMTGIAWAREGQQSKLVD